MTDLEEKLFQLKQELGEMHEVLFMGVIDYKSMQKLPRTPHLEKKLEISRNNLYILEYEIDQKQKEYDTLKDSQHIK